MRPRAHTIIVLSVALVASALGEAPSAPSDAPAEARSSYSTLSPAMRLGVSFSPPPQEGESPANAAQPSPLVLLGPVTPGTVVLAPFFVTTPRVKLTEKDTLTNKGRLALAQKQHITPLYRATFGPLSQLAAYYLNWPSILGGWHPNEAEAMTLYRQEERLEMLDEMDSLIRLETLHDSKDTKQFKRIRFGADRLSR